MNILVITADDTPNIDTERLSEMTSEPVETNQLPQGGWAFFNSRKALPALGWHDFVITIGSARPSDNRKVDFTISNDDDIIMALFEFYSDKDDTYDGD
jgi:hypothetical protein